MKISWFSQGCFQIIAKEKEQPQVSILIDPFNGSVIKKAPLKKADILIFSQKTKELEETRAKFKQAFLIDGPGEYEIRGVFLQGTNIDAKKESEEKSSTVFTISSEEMRLCFLGAFCQKELSPQLLDKIGDIDILIVPVGGICSIDAKRALKLVSQVEPKVVIPMYYKVAGPKKENPIKEFIKAFGAEHQEIQESLSIKKRDLPKEDGEMQLFVLKP